MEVMPNPAYNTDLANLDFYLSESVKLFEWVVLTELMKTVFVSTELLKSETVATGWMKNDVVDSVAAISIRWCQLHFDLQLILKQLDLWVEYLIQWMVS